MDKMSEILRLFPDLILVGALFLGCAAMTGAQTDKTVPSSNSAPDIVDLNGPDYTPPDCPEWAKVAVPDWVKPHMGYNGTPKQWRPAKKIMGSYSKGLDRYQANNYVYYKPETADYLYKDYTPLKVDYKTGSLPGFEKLAAQYTAGCKTDTEKAVALLKAMPEFFRHPTMPPLGPHVRADRNLDDETMLATGSGWCNEQARVFIRLCQVCGIPARMLHLWGQNHTVAEFYADGRWALADASNFFVAPDKEGELLSAARCHDGGDGQRRYAEAKQKRIAEMLKMSDAELNFSSPGAAQKWRDQNSKFSVEELAGREVGFGVINYPLPQ